MKLGYAFAFLSSLMFFVSSCSEQSDANRAVTSQEQQLGDNQIIEIMMTIDKGEIAASQEAAFKKVNPSVLNYARYLINQHQRNLQQLAQLTQQLGIEPKESAIAKSLENEGKHDLESLNALPNTSFDKAFINAMIKGHQDGLKLIDTKLLPQTKNPQLKIFVENFRKMVANHLEKAREVQKSL